MSHSPYLMTSHPVTSVTPTSPPETTDDDSESAAIDRVESSSSTQTLPSFPPSCQLTPPTPPAFPCNSNNPEQQPEPSSKGYESTTQEQLHSFSGRKRRQKSTAHCSGEVSKFKSDGASRGNEDPAGDHSPARKTRRKSLRIREISRQSGQSLEKVEVAASEANEASGRLNASAEFDNQRFLSAIERVTSTQKKLEEGRGNGNRAGCLPFAFPISAGKAQERDQNARSNSGNADDDVSSDADKSIRSHESVKKNKSQHAVSPSNVSTQDLNAILHDRISRIESFKSRDQTLERLRSNHIIQSDQPRVDNLGCFGDNQRQLHQRSAALPHQLRPAHPSTHRQAAGLPLVQTARKPGPHATVPHLIQLRQLQLQQEDETHVCAECNKVFKRSIYLQRHMAREHWTTAKLFKCDTCSYETKHQSNLLVHKRTHTGERPYYCGECGQRYTQGHLLKAHIRSRHSSNMQLYNMEKRSPSDVAAQATAISDAIAAGESSTKRRSPSDCGKKISSALNARTGDGCEAAAMRSAGEGLDKMQFLVEAATNFQNQKFHHRNFEKTLPRSHPQLTGHRASEHAMSIIKLESDCKSFQETNEDNEIVNYGNSRAHLFFKQNPLNMEQAALIQKNGDFFVPGKMLCRSVGYTNGEVIDLDTPEPPADGNDDATMTSFEQMNSGRNASRLIANQEATDKPTTNPSLKTDLEKFPVNRAVHSLFSYPNFLNCPQASDYFNSFPSNSHPPPLCSTSDIYPAFLGSGFPNSFQKDSEESKLDPNLRLASSLQTFHHQLPANLGSVSENEGEDQFVDVDGDDDDDDKDSRPLNLSVQRIETAEKNENPTSDLPTDLSKTSPIFFDAKKSEALAQFSAFKTFHRPPNYDNVEKVIKSFNSKCASILASGTEPCGGCFPPGKDGIRTDQPSTPCSKCPGSDGKLVAVRPYDAVSSTQRSNTAVVQSPNAADRKTLGINKPPTSGLAFATVPFTPCQGGHCPERLKLESLRRNVYRMLKVFMPYLVLDDVEDCKTDALDNFLHEVLYSKLDG